MVGDGEVMAMTLTTRQIADAVGGALDGPGDVAVEAVEQLDLASAGQVTFVRDQARAQQAAGTRASAVLVASGVELAATDGRAMIRVDNVDLAVAKVLEMLAPPPVRPVAGGEHTYFDPAASHGQDVIVGTGCYIGPGVTVGDRTVIHANVSVLDDSVIGSDCCIYPGVVVRERCVLGDRVILHSNVVIGADGFGYTPSADRTHVVKIPHIGTVSIDSDVEIGASTCVDRGKFAATTIGAGTKIDNLCQIAHNCRIGRGCLIAGQTGLAGSVTLKDGVILGGNVGVAEHITIGAGAKLAAKSGVMTDVPAGVTWGGVPARDIRDAKREFIAMQRAARVRGKRRE
jgi:UDP-3-O-[3-hydroxymyristoyl] glucosamine N-acyltransferase